MFRKQSNSKLCSSILLASFLSVNLPPGFAVEAQKSADSPYRLSGKAIPSRYELEFTPEAEKGKFSGSEDITLEIKTALNTIVMNANELSVSAAHLISDSKKNIPLQVKLDKGLERVSFVASSTIPKGNYHLQCNFNGSLNDKLVGFYRSTFKDKQGKAHYLAATQMEPTDARRMFPCLDEPSFKAVFKIKVNVPAAQTAISNAPVLKETLDKASGKKIVEFEETQAMSSYLFALLIGEFKATEVLESEGIPIRVWSVAHDPSLGNYARDNAAKLLKYLNSYFRIPYPWKKLDLIAIPDFEAGAMENPGAITFREKFLLADEKTSALSTKQDIVHITAHEMAHLWFGDLVTMKWWDDLWLNEAFATWMSDRAVDNVMPQWNIMAEFFSNRQKAFRTDSLHSTRSIQSPVLRPEDALQMFDEITYVKGASVLRMLEYFLGEKVFQDGVSAYLKAHSFNNATTDDLWKALQASSGKPVKEIMDTWCKQPGYPLLTVLSEADSALKIKQERFLLDGSKSADQLWMVPLGTRKLSAIVSTDEHGRADVHPDEVNLLKTREEILKAASGTEGLYANAAGSGFFRTSYPAAISSKMAAHLSFLSPSERLCFLSDNAALSRARFRLGNILMFCVHTSQRQIMQFGTLWLIVFMF